MYDIAGLQLRVKVVLTWCIYTFDISATAEWSFNATK